MIKCETDLPSGRSVHDSKEMLDGLGNQIMSDDETDKSESHVEVIKFEDHHA